MDNNILNPVDGGFRIDDHFRITRLTEWDDIVGYFGKDHVNVTGSENGHGSINVRNVNIGEYWFCITLGFVDGLLQGIGFVVDDKEFDLTRGWESWSEAEEMRRLKFGENWLYQQTGTMERLFSWGRTFAHYDSNGGGTHIGLRYE